MSKLISKEGREENVTLPFSPRTGHDGSYYIDCPFCPPRGSGKEDNRKKLNVNPAKYENSVVFRCNRCGANGIVLDDASWAKRQIAQLPTSVVVLEDIDINVVEWFQNSRKISKKTLKKLGIYTIATTILQLNNPDESLIGEYINCMTVAYPYKLGGQLINIKYRDSNKNFKLEKGASKIPYNIDSVTNSKDVMWVEGENDVAACTEAGLCEVISPPNGSTISAAEKEEYKNTGKIVSPAPLNLDWLEGVFQMLYKKEIHYLALDDDGPGFKLREELARRFGKDKCYIIRFKHLKYMVGEEEHSCKDPNDVLIHFGPDMLKQLKKDAEPYPVDNVITVPQLMDRLVNEFKHGKDKGDTTGYTSIDPHFTWKRGQTTVLNGYPGEGKALSIETDIPTPDGFRKMGDINPGDFLYDENGMPCKVLRVTDTMNNRPCYEMIFSDGTKIKCDEEHLWFVYDRKARASRARHSKLKPRNKHTTGIDQKHLMVKPKVVTTKHICDNLISDDCDKLNFSIDNSLPIVEYANQLLFHPYLLGLWLGDGNTANPTLHMSDDDACEIIPIINSLGIKTSNQKAKFRYGLLGIVDAMREMNVIGNKHIPEKYFTSSYNQRIELLQGLLDSDGTIHKNGKIELSLSDERLAKDAHALISSLGIKVSFNRNKSFLNGENKKDRFRMRFVTNLPVFKLSRKLKFIRKDLQLRHKYRMITSCKRIESIPVKCIEVDSTSKLYLATKSYIPTHNTSFSLNLIILSIFLHKFKWAIYSPENYPPGNLVDTMAEIIVGFSSDRDMTTRMSLSQYIASIKNFLYDHIYFIDREAGFTPEEMRAVMLELIRKHGVNAIFKDPWRGLKHQYRNLDEYLEYEIGFENRFATTHNVINLIAHHPPTPERSVKTLTAPSAWLLKGGEIWYARIYNILCIHRQDKVSFTNLKTEFHSQKIKEQKLVGIPTEHPVILTFERKSNRYLEYDKNGKLYWPGASLDLFDEPKLF